MPNNMAQQNTTTHRKRSCALSCSAGPGRRLQILCRSGEAGLILAVLGLMFFVGCTEQTDQLAEETDGQPKASRPVTIIASGDTHGWIIPCGCTSNQSGGLLRRGTYVESKRQDAVVIPVDVGGAADGTAPYQLERFRAILRGEAAMGVVVHNVGASEAIFGEALPEIADDIDVRFLSTNVLDSHGKKLAERFHLHRSDETDEVILFVGVLSTQYATKDIKVSDPGDAVLAVLDELRSTDQKYDRLIVLAYLPIDELRELGESLPEADVIIGGPTGQALSPEKIGRTTVLSATNKGKFLAEVTFSAQNAEPDAKVVEMSTDFADEPVQTENLEAFRSLLEQIDFTARDSGLVDTTIVQLADQHKVAGTESCAECHDETNDHWDKTGHAHAWQRLLDEGAHVDPYCQHCHTTGYGIEGGFVSAKRSLQRTNVGCESCHGPSAEHVANNSVRTPFDAAGICLKCHDPENSPHFEYDSYWEKIRHE